MSNGLFDPDGRTTAHHTLLAHRFLRDHPEGRIPTGIFGESPWTRRDFSRWFTKCLHEKINRQDTRNGWRKMQWQYQSDLANDARTVNDYLCNRRRQSGCSGLLRTPEMRQKYPYINIQREE